MTRRPAALPLLAGLLALYLAAPFFAGLTQLGAADWRGADWPALLHALVISVATATAATILIAAGGIPLGYLLARSQSRATAVLGVAVQLPLALPPLTSGVLLLFLLGYASPLGRLTQGALTDSLAGIVLAETFVAAPFLIIAARSAFASIDPTLEHVAATLGHTPASIFLRVSLALGWRTILSGLLLAWLRAFGEFGATVMVAYHPTSLPVLTYVAFGSEGLPAMLPILLPTLVAAIAVLLVTQLGTRSRRRPAIPAEPIASLPQAKPATPRPASPRLDLTARRHLDGFDLAIDWHTDARRLAILGPSGSGKSLTLRLLAGLGDQNGTRFQFGDRDLGRLPPQARNIAYVPQSYGLLPNLPTDRQIRFATDCDPERAAHWTDRLDLTGLEHRRPDALSLGQQQRVALARALSRRDTGLILLDEPFSALDASLRVRLRGELRALQDELCTTTILVTHDPAEAILLADELLLLQDGHVLQSGKVAALYARPANEAAARLLGATLIGHGHATSPTTIDVGAGLHLEVSGPPLAVGPVGWSVRPHQVRLEGGVYPATILASGPTADGRRPVTIRLGDQVLVIEADPGCAIAGPCSVAIDPAAIQVWKGGALPQTPPRAGPLEPPP
jgi:molybdate transport system permease protein